MRNCSTKKKSFYHPTDDVPTFLPYDKSDAKVIILLKSRPLIEFAPLTTLFSIKNKKAFPFKDVSNVYVHLLYNK